MTSGKSMLIHLFAAVIALLASACSPGRPLPDTGDGQGWETPIQLANTQWTLVSFEEQGGLMPVIEGTDVTLEFDGTDQATGSAGCNIFGGQYNAQDGQITFSHIITTERACTAEGVMEQEQRYYQALQTAGAYELAGDELEIHYDDGQARLNFVRRAAGATATPPGGLNPLANTQWRLVSFGEPSAETPVIEDTSVTLKFDEHGQAGGSGGCNSFGAPYTVEGDTISFGQITSTLMACTKEGLGGQEADYLQALKTASRFEISGDHLTIWSNDGQRALNFGAAESLATETPTSVPVEPTPSSPPPTNQPTPTPERIRFAAGANSATVTGHLEASGSDIYVLAALNGQTMTVDLSFTQGRAILAVWGADGSVLLSDHPEASRFQGILPSSQDYYILLKGRPDGSTDYAMQVTIPPREAGQPTPVAERIHFETGATSAMVTGHLEASGSDEYVLEASGGQTLTVELTFTQGQAILAIWGADGTVLMSDHAEASSFSQVLPSSQDYYILIKGRPDGATDYSMEVTIPK